MQVGLIPASGGGVPATPDFVRAVARRAEEGGFDSLWLGEHVVLPVHQRVAYPGSREGLQAPSSEPLPDPLDWLAYAAACTDRLLLGTAILLAPLHQPLVLAKRVATLDALSGGRLRLGVGIGWNEQEYDAVGVPFAGRGARLEEVIAAMRALWRDDEASFEGEHVRFEPVFSSPKPTNRAVPVVIGGKTPTAARRAGRIGDGFIPFERDLDQLATLLDVMRTAATEAGRDPDSIEVSCLGSVRRDRVARLAELGVTRMLVFMPGRDPATIDDLAARCQEALTGV